MRDYLLSLSISISGGKETYKDSLSNDESVLSCGPGPSPSEGSTKEGECPVVSGPCRTMRRCLRVRLNTSERPIANKYRKGKMKRTLKRVLKSA
ncbi:hypothetical protein R3W88_007283 [Solanum pinnatisectum]|uniref:Uncharacterized protein n=1 Tax=Solanum pinnatisectum TaxID=50273 RepID=A0AAV9M6K0_9SOLN|nr:hypothetical protein R3W88_007283 [Solanum pinnatisectum]